jgi:hypothetical protein
MKYYLSICMIIKDENNLEELILYHWIQGVEHFYIYDNESKISLCERLNKYYIFRQICTIIYFPGKPQQVNSYNHCLKNFGHETKWLGFFDGDEYILPKIHNSLRDFLSERENADAIGINWVFFGTSFHDKKQPGFVIDNYRYTVNTQDQHIKTICKPEFTINIRNPHFVDLINPEKYHDPLGNIISGPFNKIYGNSDIIQINHYYTRSLEDSYEKECRGRTDCLDTYFLPHVHNFNNDVIDNLCPNKYLDLLRAQYDILNVNYEIYRELNPDLKNILNTPDEFYEHLYKCGLIENRPYKINHKYPGFSNEYYRQNYKDLENLNDLELQKHYIMHGIYEKRVCDKLLI